MEDLIRLYQKSLEDHTFSRAERKVVRRALKAYEMDEKAQGVLRSKLFDLARTKVGTAAAQQVLDWLEEAIKTTSAATEDDVHTVHFSPGEACLEGIIGVLQEAVSVVKVCVFTVTDNRIVDALVDRHQMGVHVKVITDNDKRFDAGSDVDVLSKAGIEVRVDRTANHMHHKFALADRTWLLNGSYNWTRSAADRNHENLVITNNPTLVKHFDDEFDRLWPLMKPL